MQLGPGSSQTSRVFRSEGREGTGPRGEKPGRMEGARDACSTDGLGPADGGVRAKGFREETLTRAGRDSQDPCPRVPWPPAALPV